MKQRHQSMQPMVLPNCPDSCGTYAIAISQPPTQSLYTNQREKKIVKSITNQFQLFKYIRELNQLVQKEKSQK